EAQRQQACFEEAKTVWAQKLAELRSALDAVVAVLGDSLVPGQFLAAPIAVLTDGSRDQFPLVIAFGPRGNPADSVTPFPSEPVEVGASALFRCEPDGHVHGYRY